MNTFHILADITELFELHMHAINMSRDGASDKERWDWAVAHWNQTNEYEWTVSTEIADIGWRTYQRLALSDG